MQNANYGTGRRKSAIARVWVKPGKGNITINKRDFKEYLGRPVLEILVKSPLAALDLEGKYDVHCFTTGGGISGQCLTVDGGVLHPLMSRDVQRARLLVDGYA